MKTLIATVAFSIVLNFASAQDAELTKWIVKVVKDMIDLKPLEKYSSVPVPNGVVVNFFMAQTADEIHVIGDTISMRTNNCCVVKFLYTKKEGEYYLVFQPVRKSHGLGRDYLVVDPWVDRKCACK